MDILQDFISSDIFNNIWKDLSIMPLGVMISGSHLFGMSDKDSDYDLDIFISPEDYSKICQSNKNLLKFNLLTQLYYKNYKFDLFLNTTCIRLNYNWYIGEHNFSFWLCIFCRQISVKDFIIIYNEPKILDFIKNFNNKKNIIWYKKLILEYYDELDFIYNCSKAGWTTDKKFHRFIYLYLYLYSILTNNLNKNLPTIIEIKKILKARNNKVELTKTQNNFIKLAFTYMYDWLLEEC